MSNREYYRDLREYVDVLEKEGKLFRIKRAINKDTELSPLVRWQYRGLDHSERKAFLFENLTDSKGRKYESKVGICLLGANREIYSLALKCKPEEVWGKWSLALSNPIDPIMTGEKDAPVKEEIHMGEKLTEMGGLDEFPLPIMTPGFDCAPYISAGCVVTKDPETGERNVGVYRIMLKGPTKCGIMVHQIKHIGIHWHKCRQMGKPLEAAVIIGGVPVIGMTAAAKFPYGVDEFSVAGSMIGKPIELVKCESVDLEVPATAEIVLEGEIDTDYLEPEAPFGEYTGYMGARAMNPCFNIKCISHRKRPIVHAFLSMFPDNEANVLSGTIREAAWYKYLKFDSNIPSVLDVGFLLSSGCMQYCVIKMKKTNPSQPWQALHAANAFAPTVCKIIVTVDDDIDPRDPASVNWALSFRMQPHLDVLITQGKASDLDPSAAPPDAPTYETRFPKPRGTSAILIDATRKWDYPPVSLPARKFMERAREIWEEESLPALSPREPWYGSSLGYWPEEFEKEAEDAVKGNYYVTADKLAKKRVKAD
jgi:UbiD family decarboxylase